MVDLILRTQNGDSDSICMISSKAASFKSFSSWVRPRAFGFPLFCLPGWGFIAAVISIPMSCLTGDFVFGWSCGCGPWDAPPFVSEVLGKASFEWKNLLLLFNGCYPILHDVLFVKSQHCPIYRIYNFESILLLMWEGFCLNLKSRECLVN